MSGTDPTATLRALVEHGILTTAPASDGSAYQEYVLTPRGEALFSIIVTWPLARRGSPGMTASTVALSL